MRHALENDPIIRERVFLNPLKDRGGPDRRVAIRVGRRLLAESHATQELIELGEVIREKFSDLRAVRTHVDDTGAVVTGWQWHFRKEEGVGDELIPTHEELTVRAWPVSKTLGFAGYGEKNTQTEVIPERVWRAKRAFVRDAIKRTYEEVRYQVEDYAALRQRVAVRHQ